MTFDIFCHVFHLLISEKYDTACMHHNKARELVQETTDRARLAHVYENFAYAEVRLSFSFIQVTSIHFAY